jgi:serine phosphatase RsbU (regulator of sigma subunit)
VTAAARGALEVAVRSTARSAEDAPPSGHDDDLDLLAILRALDLAVRRSADGRRYMTCFVALLDPGKREVQFASAGHVPPYLVRPGPEGIDLSALVARGNPLGSGDALVAKVATRPLLPGDLLVWYTDGLIEGRDASGQPFGDRRMQRLLRQLDPAQLDPQGVHAAIVAATGAHRGAVRHDDDVTLVLAKVS